MGSSIKEAAKNTVNQAKSIANVPVEVGRQIKKRPLENTVLFGVPAMTRVGATMAADAVGLGQNDPITDPGGVAAPDPQDPQQRRRRQIAGRAGTLLTSCTSGTGTSLGGTGGRSTLLGL